MEFNKNKVYSAANADELKVGSMVFVADTLRDLKNEVETNNFEPVCLVDLNDETCTHRFVTDDRYSLAYLVSEPAKLKWTDLKIGDVIKNGKDTAMVIATDSEDDYHVLAGGVWLNDKNLEDWKKVQSVQTAEKEL